MDPRRVAFLLAEIWQNARLVWRLLFDPRVPLGPKMIVPGTLLYLFSPIDLLPDVMPGLGQLDDLAVILVGLRLFIHLCPHHVVQQHRQAQTSSQRTGYGQSQATDGADSVIDGTYRVVDDRR